MRGKERTGGHDVSTGLVREPNSEQGVRKKVEERESQHDCADYFLLVPDRIVAMRTKRFTESK